MLAFSARTLVRVLLFALVSSVATAASHSDLTAIRNYKSAAIENACVIESLAFTEWLHRTFPQHPSRVVYFPMKPGGYHAVAVFTHDQTAYLWDMDFGPLELGLKADSVESPDLATRASEVFRQTLVRSTMPEYELTVRGGQRPRKIQDKIRPPRGVSLAEWVYKRIAPVVTDATLVKYRNREYVVFTRETAAHVFSADRGTLVAIAPSEQEAPAAITYLLRETYGGDGNFAVVAGPGEKAIEVAQLGHPEAAGIE